MVFLLSMLHVSPERITVLSNLGTMSTAGERRQAERALVSLGAQIETSPALWSVDRATGALGLPHEPDEVEAALLASDDTRLFGVREA